MQHQNTSEHHSSPTCDPPIDSYSYLFGSFDRVERVEALAVASIACVGYIPAKTVFSHDGGSDIQDQSTIFQLNDTAAFLVDKEIQASVVKAEKRAAQMLPSSNSHLENASQCLCRAISLLEPASSRSFLHNLIYASSAASNSTKITQTEVEYDEGFNVFAGLIRFSTSAFACREDFLGCQQQLLNRSSEANLSRYDASIVLLYNLGQVRLLQRRDSDAELIFKFAFDLATSAAASTLATKSSSSSPLPCTNLSSSIKSVCINQKSACSQKCRTMLSVPILHRLGYIKYRRDDIEGALTIFELALETCYTLELDYTQQRQQTQFYLSVTLNCLGVLYFLRQQPNTPRALSLLLSSLTLQRDLFRPGEASVAAAVPATCHVRRDNVSHQAMILATTLNNVGRVYFSSDNYDLALATYQEALQLRRLVLGPNHVDVAATVYNAGQTLHQKGELVQALAFYQDFCRISSLHVNWPVRYVVLVLKCIALIHHELHHFEQALIYFEEALQVGRAALGSHPEVASILNKLGNFYYQTGDLDRALDMYKEGLHVEKEVFPDGHPNITVTLSNMGQIYKQRNDLDAALRSYKEALRQQFLCDRGPDPTTAVTLSNIGLIYYQRGRYAKALETYQEALGIRRDAFGEDHLDVASSLNSIGLVLFKLGIHELALDSFAASLRIRRSILGGSHRDVAIILYNIATIYLELGDEDRAMRFYQEALTVEKAVLGPQHCDVALTLQYIAKVHQQRGEIARALELYEEALQIQRHHVVGQVNQSIAIMLSVVADLRLQLGDVAGVMAAMTEACKILRQLGRSEEEIKLSGFDLYGFAKLHPEAAAAA